MRILAIDYGEKRIGLAWSDPSRSIAFSLKTLLVQSPEDLFTEIGILLNQEPIDEILLSYPKLMNDTIGTKAQQTIYLKTDLEQRFPEIRITLWDERLTTKLATALLREVPFSRRKRRQFLLDKTSAQILLQSYIDYSRIHKSFPSPEPPGPLTESVQDSNVPSCKIPTEQSSA